MKWFVYDNTMYYPSGAIVEADTPETAIDAFHETHDEHTRLLAAHCVVPADQVRWFGPNQDQVEGLSND